MNIGKTIKITTVPEPIKAPDIVVTPAPVRERELVPVRRKVNGRI